jgi:hypothetical protein
MNKKTTNPLLYSLDVGNGGAEGMSNCGDLVSFEPVIAPLSDKRAIADADKQPTYSLTQDGQTLVFGLEDVTHFGKVELARRLNSAERYTSPDYFRMVDVLWMQLFKQFAGVPTPIQPTGVICVPVNIYQNKVTTDEIADSLMGKREIVDLDNRSLLLEIFPKKLLILPEGVGAMTHYAYDRLLKPRGDLSGLTLMIDIGYETTDCIVFEGLRPIRESATSFPRTGMGVIVTQLADALRKQFRQVDTSRLDRALQAIAGVPRSQKKEIEIAPGIVADVTKLYDALLDGVTSKIADAVVTTYTGTYRRAVIAGGGDYHMRDNLRDKMPFHLCEVPEAEYANSLGGLTYLQLLLQNSKS